MMIKPTFLVIGAAKSGTTSLCSLLAQHPQVCFSRPKEPRFFSHDEIYARGWKWYEACFPGAEKALAIGEGSVHYSMRTLFPNTVSRIAQALPEAKFVYLVRNPLDRIVSHWKMYKRSGKPVFTTLDEDVKKEIFLPNLIDASKYWFQISAYRDFYPDDQIHVIFFEDFIKNPESTTKNCYKFLNLPDQIVIGNASQPLNASRVIHYEKPIVKLIRSLPFYPLLQKITSPELRRRLRRALFVMSVPQEKVWFKTDTHKWVVEQIEEDINAFLSLYGKSPDYWQFEGP